MLSWLRSPPPSPGSFAPSYQIHITDGDSGALTPPRDVFNFDVVIGDDAETSSVLVNPASSPLSFLSDASFHADLLLVVPSSSLRFSSISPSAAADESEFVKPVGLCTRDIMTVCHKTWPADRIVYPGDLTPRNGQLRFLQLADARVIRQQQKKMHPPSCSYSCCSCSSTTTLTPLLLLLHENSLIQFPHQSSCHHH